jgi:sugar transferase (PEP-CTERM/EpsH1 system associated)
MRVLFLTHRLPYAPNRGDRIRAFHITRTLAARFELELVSLIHDRLEGAQADVLRSLGVRVSTFLVPRARNLVRGLFSLGGEQPLTHALLDAPGLGCALRQLADSRKPDVVLAYCSGMARFALEPPLRDRPLVLDLVDVDSEKWRLLAQTTTGPKRWIYQREARCLAQFERMAASHARTTVVTNDREHRALRQLAPEATVRVVPNGIDVAAFRSPAPPSDEARVIFCGVMNYQPNVDAALWFSRYVWPQVVIRRPDARLVVVGSDPTPEILDLQRTDKSIEVTGTVVDVRPYLWGAAVSVAPLMTARGVQNKVLEALAAGLPVVITPVVLEGLPLEARAGCVIALKAEAFSNEIVALLACSGAERRAIAARATLGALAWERQLTPLVEVLRQAARPAILSSS